MRRTAFTLVELLTVVAILVLLLTVLVPSLSTARGLARAAICRNNLHSLGAAFAASKGLRGSLGSTEGGATMVYPERDKWPGIPSGAVPAADVYQCPEAEVEAQEATLPGSSGEPQVPRFSLGDLAYVPPAGVSIPLDEYQTEWYISRDGSDSAGAYREYLIQDDGARDVGRLDWHGWIDSDGLFRVYMTGELWILDHIPSTPEFSGAYAPGAGPSTCGDNNRIFLEGEPLFEGKLSQNRGQRFQIGEPGDWESGAFGPGVSRVALTNYGINSLAHRYPFGSRVVVLLDYNVLEADPEIPAETHQLLHESARHYGKLNVLTGDGAVGTLAPLELSPQLHPELWQP